MAMRMSKITGCEVAGCAYNRDAACHALAINVGGEHAVCDTFMKAARKGGDPDMTGAVGACKVETCRFNRSLECAAGAIQVGLHTSHADCRTFKEK